MGTAGDDAEATRFDCPECGRPALGIVRRLVMPGDRRSDHIALETLACSCGFRALAVTEHLQRAALRSVAERVGYRVPVAAVDLIDFLIGRCPEPAEEYCSCASHAALNRRDLRNGWNLLHTFAPFTGFALAPAAAGKQGANGTVSPAVIEWYPDAKGRRARIEGRDWRAEAHESGPVTAYELSVDDGIAIEIDAWPPFWRVPAK